jgi:hypothetical protein
MFADKQQFVIEIDSASWEAWLVGVLVAAAAGFYLGRLSRRTSAPTREPPPPPSKGKPRTPRVPRPGMHAAAPAEAPDPFEHGSLGERRVALRRAGSMVKIAIADVSLEEIELGWVVDRSTGGLGLIVERLMEPGTSLNVRPWEGGDSAPWVQVTVRTCQPADGHWKVGVAFDKTPPWSVLLLFG